MGNNEKGTITAVVDGGLKIQGTDGVEFAFSPTGNAGDFAKKLVAGDDVEYAPDGSFIKKISSRDMAAKPVAKIEDKPTTIQTLMGDALVEAEALYNSDIISAEFKEKIDWSKITISMFIAKGEKK